MSSQDARFAAGRRGGSLLLSRMAVPVLYYMAKRHQRTEPVPATAPMEAVS